MKANGLTESAAALWLERLMAFCQTQGRTCYGRYSPEVLRDYLTFHIRQETLAWVRVGSGSLPPDAKPQMPDPSRQTPDAISGCGIAWQCHAEDVIRAAVDGKTVFDWQASDPYGNAIFIADVVATNSEAALALVQRFATRFPAWREQHLYTYRHGKLVRLEARSLIWFFQQHYSKRKV